MPRDFMRDRSCSCLLHLPLISALSPVRSEIRSGTSSSSSWQDTIWKCYAFMHWRMNSFVGDQNRHGGFASCTVISINFPLFLIFCSKFLSRRRDDFEFQILACGLRLHIPMHIETCAWIRGCRPSFLNYRVLRKWGRWRRRGEEIPEKMFPPDDIFIGLIVAEMAFLD